jgi:hypothetical protein
MRYLLIDELIELKSPLGILVALMSSFAGFMSLFLLASLSPLFFTRQTSLTFQFLVLVVLLPIITVIVPAILFRQMLISSQATRVKLSGDLARIWIQQPGRKTQIKNENLRLIESDERSWHFVSSTGIPLMIPKTLNPAGVLSLIHFYGFSKDPPADRRCVKVEFANGHFTFFGYNMTRKRPVFF